MNPRVTQADIALQARVHTTTVSLALRNSPSIPAATRERIQAIAADLGYQPDPVLQALMAHRSHLLPNRRISTLAYVTNWESAWGWQQAPAHAEFYVGASRKAPELGYQLEHFWVGEPGMTHVRLSEILFNRGITGIIVASHVLQRDRPLEFDWSRFSAVKIDCFPHAPALHHITNDQRANLQLALRRIRAAGYRRVGIVMPWWWDICVDFAWSAGFLAEQARLPATDRIPILFYDDVRREHAPVPPEDLKKWLHRHSPEAIISYSPFIQPAFAALGLRIPDDVAYVDLSLAKPDGTTAGIHENCERVGELAVEILAGQLRQNTRGVPAVPTATLVEGNWIDGASLPHRTVAPTLKPIRRARPPGAPTGSR